MKKMLVVIAFLILAGCHKSTIVQMPEYEGRNIRDVSLGIVEFPENIVIDNEDDVTDDIGEGDAIEVYYTFLKENLPAYFKQNSHFTKIDFIKLNQKEGFEDVLLEINKDEKITFNVPPESFKLKPDSLNYDYLLFVKNLKIIRAPGQSGVWVMGPNGTSTMTGGSGPTLDKTLKFYIWANDESKIVTYGKAISSTSFLFAMTKGNWESGLQKLCINLLKESPFYKNTNQRRR